ncbi:MAG: DEAD/DEAH box helicase, partial [bacterium]|nr:DEAD/DEAH box helicase [bacterium]
MNEKKDVHTDTPSMRQYDSLPLHYKQFLQVLSIIFEPTTKTNLLQVTQKCNIRNEQDGRVTHADFKLILRSMRESGFLMINRNNRYCCPATIKEDVIWEAAKDDNLEPFAKVIREHDEFNISSSRHSYSVFHRISSMQCQREIRIGMYSGDTETIEHYMGIFKKEGYDYDTNLWEDLFNSPFNPDRFADVPMELQSRLMRNTAPACIPQLKPFKPVQTTIQHLLETGQSCLPNESSKEFFRLTYLSYLLCEGKLEEAGKQLRTDSKEAYSYFLNAWYHFQKNKTDEAIACYKQGLKIYQGESGKSGSFHPDVTNLFYILMLIKNGAPKNVGTISAITKHALKNGTQFRVAFEAFELYVLLKKNELQDIEGKLRFGFRHIYNYIDLLITALVMAWFFEAKLETFKPLLEKALKLAHANGYHWFSLQFASLLHRCDGSEEYEALIGTLKKSTAGWCLLDIIKTEAPWERSLKAIEALLPRDVITGETKPERLVWILKISEHYLDITPKLQKRKPNGTWTDGRVVAQKNLYNETLTCMTQQDHSIANSMGSALYDFRSYYSDRTVITLAAMVGHPLIFNANAPGIPVEAVAKELEVIAKQDRNNFNINFSMEVTEADYYYNSVHPHKIEVTAISPAQRKLADILGPEGLTIPIAGKGQLQDTLASLSSLVPVQSELTDHREDIPMIEADARLHLRLLPLDNGLKMDILVRPFPGGDRYYTPGKGGGHLIAHIEGKSTQTRRDTDLEIQNHRFLWKNVPSIADRDDGSGSLVLDDTEDVLQMLMELETVKKDIVLQWPEGETFSIKKEVTARQVKININQSHDWFSLTGEVAIDESLVLSLRQLMELVSATPSRFIDLGDGQFIALTNAFRRKLTELNAMTGKSGKDLTLTPTAVPAMEELWDEFSVEGDTHWLELRKRIRESREYNPELPGTLQAELRDYQLLGFKWLSRLAYLQMGACLADDMGLGKTVQALAVILQRAPQGPTLVVAPKSVTLNWLNEAFRFAPTLNPIVFGGKDRKKITENIGPFDMLVCSYGLLQQESELLTSIKFTTIVLDEAQAIKNISALRTKAAMSLQGGFKMITTGTPIENHLGELWSLFNFINPGLLGTLQHFTRVFAQPILKTNSSEARRQLKRLLHPFILRRLKSEVLEELPEKTEISLSVEQSTEEAALYEAMRRDALEKLESPDEPSTQKRFRILAEIMRLRQACCHPGLVAPDLNIGSSKLALLGELVSELRGNNHKALIFSQFVGHLAFIR